MKILKFLFLVSFIICFLSLLGGIWVNYFGNRGILSASEWYDSKLLSEALYMQGRLFGITALIIGMIYRMVFRRD